MNFIYDKTNVYYDVFGQGDRLILIHGWGGPQLWYQYVDNLVQMGLQVFVVHLPGFGNSDTPNKIIDSFWYADLIKHMISELEIKEPILMGHSLGGKICLILQAKYNLCSKLILVDSAGFRRFYFSVWLKKLIVKLGKSFLKHFKSLNEKIEKNKNIIKMFGSEDYINSAELKDSFKKIIEEDIRLMLKNIKCPTLLIWGDYDLSTPLIDGVEMKKYIGKNAILKIIKNGDHFPFINYPLLFFRLINSFLRAKNED